MKHSQNTDHGFMVLWDNWCDTEESKEMMKKAWSNKLEAMDVMRAFWAGAQYGRIRKNKFKS